MRGEGIPSVILSSGKGLPQSPLDFYSLYKTVLGRLSTTAASNVGING